MKKSSKFISLLLAVLMTVSCFTGFAVFNAAAADDTLIYFETPTIPEWGTTKSVFCHFYKVYGDKEFVETSWQSKSESCKKVSGTTLYSFDVSKVGELDDDCDYALLFSTKDSSGASHQTGNITFGKECYGDTIYLTGETSENPVNSDIQDYIGVWKNHSDKYGMLKSITSKANVVGTGFANHQPKAEPLAISLHDYLLVGINEPYFTPEANKAICDEYGVTPLEVYNYYKDYYADELAEGDASTPTLENVQQHLGLSDEDITEPVETTTEPEETTEPETEPETTTEPEETTTEPEETTTEPETEPETTTEPETEPETTTEPETEPETTEPVVEKVYGLCGTALPNQWDASTAPAMTKGEDGLYTYVIENLAVGNGYMIKVVVNNSWEESYGIGEEFKDNLVFNVVNAPSDVTVTFNADTKELKVSGENVKIPDGLEIERISAVGNGDGTWLYGNNWGDGFQDERLNLTEIAEGIYEITFEDIDAFDNYQVKFAANGAWTDSWGGVFTASGEQTAADYNGDNITFAVSNDGATVKLQLDLREFDYATKTGAKFTVTVTEPEPLGVYGDVDGNKGITVNDATQIQRASIKLTTFDELQTTLADVNGDGRVSVIDATLVQRYSINLTGNKGRTGENYYGEE